MATKAIETEYNGYRFRSRLEARWAVFFDFMGIKYLYEPEGYELSDGSRYLPDFFLPELGLWVEVKPDCPDRYPELEKCLTFVDDDPKRVLTVLGNIPQEKNGNAMVWHPAITYDPLDKALCVHPILLVAADIYLHNHAVPEMRCFGYVTDLKEAYRGDSEVPVHSAFYLHGAVNDSELNYLSSCMLSEVYTEANERLRGAYRAARQARFEFGETPKVRGLSE